MSQFRYRLFQILILLAFIVIIVRVFQLQILEFSKHKVAVERNASNLSFDFNRADIQDRNGKMLAINLKKYILEFYPVNKTKDRSKLASSLKEIFPFKNPELLDNSKFAILSRDINKEQAEKIKALRSNELFLRKINTRFYPQGKLASNILGYVDLYGEAKSGIEKTLEKVLLSEPSGSLELSLDARLQVFSEEALEKQIKDTEAERGTVICMKVKTGEILAWAISPNYDPNKYYDYPISHIKNWAIVDTYQPGSIFKIITAAAAIDSGSVPKEIKYLDRGYIQVDNWKITNHDYKPNSTEAVELDIKGLFQRSSNPFAAYLALTTGSENFYNYIKIFGFGQTTKIELMGESKGILKNPNHWKKSDIASTALGHGAISVTPIQLISAVNVVANNGLWVRPSLIKKFNDSGKPIRNIVDSYQTQMQVISPEVAKFIMDSLSESIKANLEEKKSVAGNIQGLKVAGKTGTSEKLSKGGFYSHKNTIASFVGIFPADSPEYIVLTVIDDPKKEGGWGATVAAPLFNKIAKYMKDLYEL